MKKSCGFAVLILAASVISSQALADDITKKSYVCDNNESMEVIYINSDKNSYAVINQVNEMIPMQQMKMASGANYEAIDKNYTYKLYTKGSNADLVEQDDKPILSNCKTD